jgi:hypothetical protein
LLLLSFGGSETVLAELERATTASLVISVFCLAIGAVAIGRGHREWLVLGPLLAIGAFIAARYSFEVSKENFILLRAANNRIELTFPLPKNPVEIDMDSIASVTFGVPGKTRRCYLRLSLADGNQYRSALIPGDCKDYRTRLLAMMDRRQR